MSTAAVLTLIQGLTEVDKLRFASTTASDGTYRITYTPTDTSYIATNEIDFTTPILNIPGATFEGPGATWTKMSVAGASHLSSVEIGDLVADRVISNNFEAHDPALDTITVTSKRIQLNSDVYVEGTLDSTSSRELLIRDKIITLGAVDADADGTVDVDDTTRDGAGLIVPGVPDNMPVGTDGSLYEHSLRWRLNAGDFKPDGSLVEAHERPAWVFKGGAIGVASADTGDRKSSFFFAPYHTADVASIGLYYAIDTDVKLMQTFAAPTAGLGSLTLTPNPSTVPVWGPGTDDVTLNATGGVAGGSLVVTGFNNNSGVTVTISERGGDFFYYTQTVVGPGGEVDVRFYWDDTVTAGSSDYYVVLRATNQFGEFADQNVTIHFIVA